MIRNHPLVKPIVVFLIIFFMITGDLAAKSISISPLTIKTGNGKHRFATIFDLTNRTNRHQALAALIVFKNDRVKWWRGVRLPLLGPGDSQKYHLQFNSRLILAMDFEDIYVLIYDKDYKQYIDSSSKHGSIKSDVEFDQEVTLKLYDKSKSQRPTVFVMGEKKAVLAVLKLSKKANAKVLSDAEIAALADDETEFVQSPFGAVVIAERTKPVQKPKPVKKPEPIQQPEQVKQIKEKPTFGKASDYINKMGDQPEMVKKPDFIEEQDAIKIDVDQVFAQYFTFNANPRLTYQSLNSNIEPDYINVSVDKPERLDIAEQEKVVSLYVDRGQSEKAIVFLSDQIILAPEDVDTYINLSNVYLATGDKTSALEVLNSSLANISFSKRLAVNQELTERSRQAVGQVDVKEAEFLAKQFAVIGQSFLDEGKYFEALRAFESLETFNPDYPGLKSNINFCREKIREIELQKMMANLEKEKAAAERQAQVEAAAEESTAGIEETAPVELPETAPAVTASSITKRGFTDEAGNPDPDKMIDFYLANGELESAEFFLKEQIESDPQNIAAVLKLVELLQDQARFQRANDLMSETLGQLPESTTSSIVVELQTAEEVQLELSHATLLAKAYENQGVDYFNNKDCTSAHPLFKDLLNAVPGYPGVAQRISSCEEALGINQKLVLKETTKAVLTADVIKANGQILLTGIPRFSIIYLFKQGNLVQQQQAELSQFRAELEPGEYSLFIQSYGYEDYQSNITISAQTLLNENVTLTPVEQAVAETAESVQTQEEVAKAALTSGTRMHRFGW